MRDEPEGLTREAAMSLVREGRVQEARDICRNLCAREQAEPADWTLLGRVQLQLGDAAGAERSGRIAVGLNPHDAAACCLLAESLSHQGKATEAFERLHASLRLEPRSSLLHSHMAAMLAHQHDTQGAIRHYRKAVECDRYNVMARQRLGDILLHQGCFQDAAGEYRHVLSQLPNATPALMGLGNACMALHGYSEAIENYLQLLAIDPSNWIVHHNLAEAYQNQSRLKEAESCYLEAIRLCPRRAEPYLNLGRVLQKQGRLQEAVESHRKALTLDPGCGAAHHNIALCLYDDHDLAPALTEFRTAVGLNPENVLSRCLLGILYLQEGDAVLAAEHLMTAERSPQTASILESWLYAAEAGRQARFFSTTSQVLNYAIGKADPHGLYLEFGVYYGASIGMIASRAPGVVHGFDSFAGLPENWETGSGFGNATEQAGTYTTRGTLPAMPGNVELHVGVFEETLPGFLEQHPGTVSFINVDCDLYSSTRTVLQNLGERIGAGCVIVFDEYFCYPEWRQHEYRAFQEFVVAFGVRYEYLAFSFFTGQAVVRILDTGLPAGTDRD